MKNLMCLFVCAMFGSVNFAQIPAVIIEDMVAMEEENAPIINQGVQTAIPVRVINHVKSEKIFIRPEMTLSEAELNLINDEGAALLAHHFDHLSEVDLSLVGLPEGDYQLQIHSREGIVSKALRK